MAVNDELLLPNYNVAFLVAECGDFNVYLFGVSVEVERRGVAEVDLTNTKRA